MISMRKSFVIKALPLVLIMFTVFSISLTENIQIADGLTASGKQMIYEVDVGESQLLTWKVINDEEVPINLEFYATGKGSEFLIYEKFITMEAKQVKEFEILVKIPSDHKDNVEYHTKLFALQKGDVESSGAQVIINVQMETHPVIRIGDNPLFESEIKETTKDPVKEAPKPIESKPIVEKEIAETLEEKMARISEANKEVIVDDVWEESFEEEAVPEYEPEPEFELEPKDIVTPTEKTIVEEKIECDFFAMILSWFGMGKC